MLETSLFWCMHIYNQAQLFEAVTYRTQALDALSTATAFPVRYSPPFSFSCFFFFSCAYETVSLRVVYCGPSSHLIHLSCLLFLYHFITLVFLLYGCADGSTLPHAATSSTCVPRSVYFSFAISFNSPAILALYVFPCIISSVHSQFSAHASFSERRNVRTGKRKRRLLWLSLTRMSTRGQILFLKRPPPGILWSGGNLEVA